MRKATDAPDVLRVGVGHEHGHRDLVHLLLEERIQKVVCVLGHVTPQ